MNEPGGWTKEAYERSVSSRCWDYTPYLGGWEKCPELRADETLRRLVSEERALGQIPAAVREVVERSINFPPFCLHYAFPAPYLDVLDAIGREAAPRFVHGCYTADRARKERMQDYVFCLEEWLSGVRDGRTPRCPTVDWPRVRADLARVLGPRTPLKELLVHRIVHRQKWWVQSLAWDDDRRDVFYRGVFLGDLQCAPKGHGHYGNPEFRDPFFAELEVPEVRQMEEQLAATCPDWPWFLGAIHHSWLCAPKAFRFLERLLWCVGKGRAVISLPSHRVENAEDVPDFLQCADTWQNVLGAGAWSREFLSGLRAWIDGRAPSGEVASDVHRRLGPRTPTKLWLAGLYLRKMEFLARYRVH